jgi:hypothetical protein
VQCSSMFENSESIRHLGRHIDPWINDPSLSHVALHYLTLASPTLLRAATIHVCMRSLVIALTTPTYWFGSCGHSPSIYRTPLDTTALGALLPVTAWMCCLMHGRACATTTLPVIVTEETSLFFLLLLSLTLKNN